MFASNIYGWCTQLDIFSPATTFDIVMIHLQHLKPHIKIVICKYFLTKVTMFFGKTTYSVLHHPLAELSFGDLYYVRN